MASLADLAGVYEPQNPTGFGLADISLQSGLGQADTDISRSRLLRNFSQFQLPDLASSQAAKGAYWSSATRDQGNRLATGAQDNLSDLELASNKYQSQLTSNALLAQTGVAL